MRLEPAHEERGPIATAPRTFSVPVIMLRMVVSSGLILLPMTHHHRGPLGLAEMARCGDRDYTLRISVSRRNSRFTTKGELNFERSSSISRTRRSTIRPQRAWDHL